MIRSPVLRRLVSLLLLGGACAVAAEPCPDQPARAGVTAFCGVPAPEDIVVLEDRYLVISSMAPAPHLYGFDVREESLGPLRTVLAPLPAGENWGDPTCPLPPAMVSHGLDLARRDDGARQLLVVNHGERESIEMFEVLDSAGGPPSLRWRGCVLAADNAQFNDVAALPDGGFLATDPITASWQLARMLLGAAGLMDTGRVYRWRPKRGYEAVPHTEGAYPNGITLAADRDSFYLNLYLDGRVQEHDLNSGEVLRTVAVNMPDNSALDADGALLVASHRDSILSLLRAILSEPAERNEIPFEILAVNAATFSAAPVFVSDGRDMGGGTVAVRVGNNLYIGAFRGDRILRIDAAALTEE